MMDRPLLLGDAMPQWSVGRRGAIGSGRFGVPWNRTRSRSTYKLLGLLIQSWEWSFLSSAVLVRERGEKADKIRSFLKRSESVVFSALDDWVHMFSTLSYSSGTSIPNYAERVSARRHQFEWSFEQERLPVTVHH